MRLLIDSLLDWVYPPRCMSCRNPLPLEKSRLRNLWLCAHCEGLFLPLETPGCEICSVPVKEGVSVCASCYGKSFFFLHNRSAFAYDGLIRDMIHEIKFRRRRHVAQGLGRLWADMYKKSIPTDALLTPLPMHRSKKRYRGFDQAIVMAKAFAEATGNPYCNILERTKDTPPQSGLHPSQRIDNVNGAFKIKPGSKPGQKYVLIDDIYTTGASLNECAKILKLHGALEVYAITLAIAVKKP